jgi:L-alanine-DL-glutamate epimerase-like enolase superfamily enzyme
MKIIRVEANYLTDIPTTPPPLMDAPNRASVVVTEIETDDGITGYGMTGGPAPQSIAAFINHQARDLLLGQDPMLTERIWQQMFRTYNQRYLTGVWSSGMSAVDIALWDIKGKAFGMPVWRLLGGAQNPVPAYVTFGLAAYDDERLVGAAKHWAGLGHDKLKMVVGVTGNSQDPEADARRVASVRDAIGPDVQLMFDANYLMSYHHALRLCKLVEPLNITWFEEPVYGNDVMLLADLRRATTIPVAAGQNEGHRFRHRELLMHRAVDILQPNVVSVGGYTEAVKVAGMAQAFNIPIANGGAWPCHNMHLQAGMSNGWRVEFHYLSWMMYEAVCQSIPQPEKGWVTVPETPGLGLDPKPGIIQEYRSS